MTYDIRPTRRFSRDDKARDLLRLITWGKSLLDPPPALGRTKALARKPARGWIGLGTKAPAPKEAEADPIRAQNPPVDRGDAAALKILANIDPKEREAKIDHIKVHGACSSWKFFQGPMALGVVAACKAEGALRFGRMYSYWSDSRLPNNRGPMFRPAKPAKPLPGSHLKPTTPWEDLVAQAKRSLLRQQDERQLWAYFRDTGDEDVRQRLIDSCAAKCILYARKMPEQERWAAFLELRDEVATSHPSASCPGTQHRFESASCAPTWEGEAMMRRLVAASQLDLRTTLGRGSDLRTALGRLKAEFVRQTIGKTHDSMFDLRTS